MRKMMRSLPVIALLAFGVNAPSFAQHGPDVSRGNFSTSIDTGDFAPGRISLTRYDTPALCLAAVRNAARVAQRTTAAQLAAQFLHETPEHDTLPARSRSIASMCVTRFSKTTGTRDLPELVTLALFAGDTVTAYSARDRWISTMTAGSARDSALDVMLGIYLSSQPARFVEADAFIAQAGKRGWGSSQWRVEASNTMLSYARDVFDRAEMRKWADHNIALADTLKRTRTPGVFQLSWYGYQTRLTLAYSQQQSDSMRVIAERAVRDFRTFPADTSNAFLQQLIALPADSVLAYMSPGRVSGIALHQQVHPLDASHWYPASRAASDSAVATLVIQPNEARATSCYGWGPVRRDPSVWCPPPHEIVRRLAERYAPRGLRVVLAVGTADSAAAVFGSLSLPADQAADRLAWYYLDKLKLPVTLAIVPSVHGQARLPMPDGRRPWAPRCPTTSDQGDSLANCVYLRNPMVLLGRRGELLYAGMNDPVLDIAIDRALADAVTGTETQ